MATAAPAPVSKRPKSRRSPARHWLVQNTPLVLSFVILAFTLSAWIFFYYGQLGRFPDTFDVTQVTNSSLPLVFAALGQSFVVLTRGLDLSVGGTISLATAVTAQMMSDSPGSILFWSAVVLVMGAGIGLVNGLLVARARLAPILVTLATLSILQGLAIFVLPKPGGLVPKTLTNVLTNRSAPTGLLFVALALLGWFVFRRSTLGEQVFALGNDESAARAHGVPVTRAKVLAYVLSGVCASTAGLFVAATTTSGDATIGNPFVLTSIAAVVIGGISFFGGRGSAVGAVVGAFVLGLIVNVLFFAGINPLYQSLYEGLFLILAVVLGLAASRVSGGRA